MTFYEIMLATAGLSIGVIAVLGMVFVSGWLERRMCKPDISLTD